MIRFSHLSKPQLRESFSYLHYFEFINYFLIPSYIIIDKIFRVSRKRYGVIYCDVRYVVVEENLL